MTADPLTLDELATLAEGGANIWVSAVAHGLSLGGAEDRARYELGDLALLVGSEYGADRLGQFARSINRPAKQLQEYRTVCRYYPRIVREQIFTACPRVTYTHLRTAMRLHDLDRSVAVLRAAHEQRWPVERMAEEIDRMRGKPAPPAKAWEGPVQAGTITRNPAGHPSIVLVFLDASWEQFPQNQPVMLKVYVSVEDAHAER